VTPRLLAMLAVVAVFVPSFFMTGVSRSLFVPLSLAVGFAMIASFLLSSSLLRSSRYGGSDHTPVRSRLKERA
jgi:Cu/Ag efflux pump CusA